MRKRGHAELDGDDPTFSLSTSSITLLKRLIVCVFVLALACLIAIPQVQLHVRAHALSNSHEDQQELLQLATSRGIEFDKVNDVDGDGDLDYTLRPITEPSRPNTVK